MNFIPPFHKMHEERTLFATVLRHQGKIAYMERLGGYYISGEDPTGEMMIVNQNAATLAKLQKTGKTVKIQGRFTIGAGHFFIARIGRKTLSWEIGCQATQKHQTRR